MQNTSEKKIRPGIEGRMDKNQLATLVDMDSPEAVYNEVVHILQLINPKLDISPVDNAFCFTRELYEGYNPGYKACNTPYHNYRHITDTFLAMARLLHGAHLSGENFSERQMTLGLISVLMHDTGMLQEAHDSEGTGAKFTQDHVKLSIDFMEQQADRLQLTGQEVTDLRDMILCSDLMAEIPSIDFSTPENELLGKMLELFAGSGKAEVALLVKQKLSDAVCFYRSIAPTEYGEERPAMEKGIANKFEQPDFSRYVNDFLNG